MDEVLLNRLAERIRSLRKQYKLTQEELAEKSGVSYKHLQKLEGKYYHDPQLGTLIKIANVFNISVSELLDFPTTTKKENK